MQEASTQYLLFILRDDSGGHCQLGVKILSFAATSSLQLSISYFSFQHCPSYLPCSRPYNKNSIRTGKGAIFCDIYVNYKLINHSQCCAATS